jgi:antitoxin HicB
MVHAVKRVLAWQVAQEMAALKLSKKSDGKAHENQSQQVDRLLDPKNDKVQLDTVQRPAVVVGRKLHVELA